MASTTASAPARASELASSSRCRPSAAALSSAVACPWRPRGPGSSRSRPGPSRAERSSTSTRTTVQPGGRGDVRDAAAHLSAADDAEGPDLHGRTLSNGQTGRRAAASAAVAVCRRSATTLRTQPVPRRAEARHERDADGHDRGHAPDERADERQQRHAAEHGESGGERGRAPRRARRSSTSFWPRSRKSAAIPKIFATTATPPRRARSESRAARAAATARRPRARKSVSTPSAPASSEPDQSSSADIAARASGDAKKPEQRERHGEPGRERDAGAGPTRTEAADGALLPRSAPHLRQVELQERARRRDAALDRQRDRPAGRARSRRRRRADRPRPIRRARTRRCRPRRSTSPETRAAIRTSASTATTRPGSACETTTSRRTEVIEPGAARTRRPRRGAGPSREGERAAGPIASSCRRGTRARTRRRPKDRAARSSTRAAMPERAPSWRMPSDSASRPAGASAARSASPGAPPTAGQGQEGRQRRPRPSEICSAAVRAGRASSAETRSRPARRSGGPGRSRGRKFGAPAREKARSRVTRSASPGDRLGGPADSPSRASERPLAASIGRLRRRRRPGRGRRHRRQKRARRRRQPPRRQSDPGGVGTVCHVTSPANLSFNTALARKSLFLTVPRGMFLTLGDLLVGQAGEVAQGDQLPKIGRKLLDRPAGSPCPARRCGAPRRGRARSSAAPARNWPGRRPDRAFRAERSGGGACAGGRWPRCPRSGRARSRTCTPG